MSWSGIASNQCVSLNNLRDAIANNIFIAKTTVPAGTKQITKTEALAYVDIQTAPLASKASNQLVVKNNLNAAVYTYQRYDLNTTTCATSNPIPHWSYYDIPYGSYNLNGTGSLYQLIPATHTTFTNQITSYVSTTCTPVTQYTYVTSDVNTTTCATSNTIQWWSYNNYPNGLYYINGPGTLYSLSASTHTNYSNQITSVSVGTCAAQTKYTYKLYYINTCNCNLYNETLVFDTVSYSAGYYYLLSITLPDDTYYITPFSHTDYTNYVNIQSASVCFPQPCYTWYFNNSGDVGEPAETWTYVACGGSTSTVTISVGQPSQSRCVEPGTVPSVGSQGDNPYTFDETCCT
jgi:hypothetical protein